MNDAPAQVWTVGHSTLSQADFLALLARWSIEAIADVRRHAGSRRFPHFHVDALSQWLPAAGIDYAWIPALGGRRRSRPDSPNRGWRSESFRGYADHLASAEFAQGLAQLLELARTRRTAIMCAELLWWRCHRALISDVLLARGTEVLHIQDAGHCTPHPYTSPARLVDGHLTYPAPEA